MDVALTLRRLAFAQAATLGEAQVLIARHNADLARAIAAERQQSPAASGGTTIEHALHAVTDAVEAAAPGIDRLA
jgi:hypothetical protein